MARSSKVNPLNFLDLAKKGLSNVEIASAFSVSEASVRRGLRKLGFVREEFLLEESNRINLEQPFVHVGDIIIAADMHIPLHSVTWTNKLITTARLEGIRSLILAGDFFNMDAISRFEPKQEEADLWVEVREGQEVLKVLMKSFDTIYYIPGNHDLRLVKALNFKLKFTEATKLVFGAVGEELLSKLQISNLDHLWVENWSGEKLFYICHPDTYSKIPLSVPRNLASKIDAHIVSTHTHHCAIGFANDGKKIVAEVGGLFDRIKTKYIQRTTSYPVWVNGFAYIKDGDIKIVAEGWNN